MIEDQLPALLKLALEAAQAPAALIMSGYRNESLNTETKSDGSPVTDYDRGAEQIVREHLAKHQPEDWPVLGEEYGAGDSGSARYRWVIDPIDGTLAYSRGMPTFGTLLAFEEVATRRSLVGVVHCPAMGETYSAARGLGAWCNGKRIHVAPARPLRQCVISVTAEHHFRLAGVADSHEKLVAQVPFIRCYADCWAHAMIARGALDALVEFRLGRWDIAASEVIIEEAGGTALVREATYDKGKYDAVIGSPTAVSEVAALIGFGTGSPQSPGGLEPEGSGF